MSDLCSFYCLSFNNEERKKQMEERFEKLQITCKIYKGVGFDDTRLKGHEGVVWSNMFGMLDMIKDFYYNSENEFGIFCENDIYIHKDLVNNLPKIIDDFKLLNLDVLLLGYLINFEITDGYLNFALKSSNKNLHFIYRNYPNNLWGSQMFMYSKKHAKYLIDKYTLEYATNSCNKNKIHDKLNEEQSVNECVFNDNYSCFSPDWSLTKEGNRAIIYPMMAVESSYNSNDYYHNSCTNCNYDPTLFF